MTAKKLAHRLQMATPEQLMIFAEGHIALETAAQRLSDELDRCWQYYPGHGKEREK